MSLIQETLEAKLPGLLEQHPNCDEQFVRTVASGDPTGCRFTGWMLKTMQEGQWDILDLPSMTEVLKTFEAVQRDASWKGQPDINQYTSLDKLVEDINQHGQVPALPAEPTQHAGAKQLAKTGNIEIWEISTPEAAALFGRGQGGAENPSTDWPVKSPKIAAKYLVSGRLYVVTKNGQSHVLVHFVRAEARDAKNLSITTVLAKEIAPLFTGQDFATEFGPIKYRPGGWQLDDTDIEQYLRQVRRKFIAQRKHGFYKDSVWIEPVTDDALLERRWKAKEPEFRHLLKQAQGDRDLDIIERAGRKHPEPTGMQALANAVYELEHA